MTSLSGAGIPWGKPKPLRCAVYTRVAAAAPPRAQRRGHQAQRASCAAFIRSQEAWGWEILGERYEDRGLGSAVLRRPAFRRLLADVEAGRVDVVVATRWDRLCRSLFDAVQILDRLARSDVSFSAADVVPIRSVSASGLLAVRQLARTTPEERA